MLHFRNDITADVLLRLINPDGTEYHGNPLYLHSYALKKSEFYEAVLSERWSNSEARPLELKVNIHHNNTDYYLKCINFLYLSASSKHFSFANVEETLAILQISSELLFPDGVEECMRYLEAVRWTREETEQIRGLVQALQLKPSSDLAARLGISECKSDCEHVKMTGEMLGALLSLISSGASPLIRDITDRIIVANLGASASPGLADVTKSALVKEIRSNLDVFRIQLITKEYFLTSHNIAITCSALQWLLRPQLLFEMAVSVFAQQHDLAEASARTDVSNRFAETLFNIAVSMVEALGDGKVICQRSVRLSLLANWLPLVQKLSQEFPKKINGKSHDKLAEGLIALIETLPLVDQKQILQIWAAALHKYPKSNLDLSMAFDSWYNKLLQTHRDP